MLLARMVRPVLPKPNTIPSSAPSLLLPPPLQLAAAELVRVALPVPARTAPAALARVGPAGLRAAQAVALEKAEPVVPQAPARAGPLVQQAFAHLKLL